MEERHERIVELLIEQSTASVTELGELFGVSAVTVRTDLNDLAKQGRIIRTRGGAKIADERTRQEFSFSARQRVNAKQKHLIGLSAAQLVESGEAILLDASTTAVAVAKGLKLRRDLRDVTVVTTGIWTALEMLGMPAFDVVLTGGYVRDVTGSITGQITNEVLSQFNFHRAFLGAWGVSVEHGLTEQPLVEVELKQAIVHRSEEIVAVVDGSKFGRVGLAAFASVANINQMITDETAPVPFINAFRQAGIQLLVASENNIPAHG